MKKQVLFLTLATAMVMGLTGCGKSRKSGNDRITGTEGVVQNVISGNEIELRNGLKVEILGIEATEHTKQYLEKQVKGQTVRLTADSEQKSQTIKTKKSKVRAYVKIKGDRYDISGKLLKDRTAKLRQTGVRDSLEHFIAYAQDPDRRVMDLTELRDYMKNASFQIRTESGLGTGFFINDNGLAITNNHVLDGTESAIVYFFNEKGNEIDETNYRRINRIIATIPGKFIDFTIFQVLLDNGEKVRYMPLAQQHAKEGERIAKIGCPRGLPCDFKDGVISNYFEGFFTHGIPTNPGDSGGPVVNMKGEVIGVNQSGIRDSDALNFAVDAVMIKDYLEEHDVKYGR